MVKARNITGLFVLLILLISFGCQQLSEPQATPVAPPGAELFKTKCGSCHDLGPVLDTYRTEDLWRSTISRMRDLHGVNISRIEVDMLVDYHVQRQQQAAAIFAEKCQQCHSGERFLAKDLTPESATEIIKLMQQQAGNKIEEKDIEIIVRYHAQAQQADLDESLRGVFRTVRQGQPLLMKGRAMFKKDCTRCHQISRVLGFQNDSKLWGRSVRLLRQMSNDSITTREIDRLVDLHVRQKRKEVASFKNTCNRCHDDRRINQRSMSREQWRATVERMLQKIPELYSDERVSLIAAFFHRRELALAQTFSGNCLECHGDDSTDPTSLGFDQRAPVSDKDLVAMHAERQTRVMQIYQSRCFRCHPDRVQGTQMVDPKSLNVRTRSEWIAFIAGLQDIMLNEVERKKIGSQIDYHIYGKQLKNN